MDYLDHGLSEDMNKRLALEPWGCETGGYDADNPAPKLPGSTQISKSAHMSAHSHCDCYSSYKTVHDPRFAGRPSWRRRRWWTNRHGIHFVARSLSLSLSRNLSGSLGTTLSSYIYIFFNSENGSCKFLHYIKLLSKNINRSLWREGIFYYKLILVVNCGMYG